MSIKPKLKTTYNPHIKIDDIFIVDSIKWGDESYISNTKYVYVGIDPGIVNLGITVLYCTSPLTNSPLQHLLQVCIKYLKSYTAAGCPWTSNKTEKSIVLKNIINKLVPNNVTKIAIEEQLVKTNNGFIEGVIYGSINDCTKIVQGKITSVPVTRLLDTADLPFTYDRYNSKKRKQECFNQILKILNKTTEAIQFNHRSNHFDTTDSLILAICGAI